MTESNRIEYKAKLTDSLEKEIVAFLNYKEGGIVYIGIDKFGESIGLDNCDELQLKIKDRLKNNIVPVFEIYDDRLEITSSGGLSVIKNREKFFKGYSNPINREIMRIYKDLDMVEQLGSGMNRILSYYKKDIFIFDDDFLKMVFISNYDAIDGGSMGGSMGGSIGGSIELTSRQQEIIEIIKANNKIGYRTLAEKLNINDSAVKKHLNSLKDKGILKRVGGTRGYWEVVE